MIRLEKLCKSYNDKVIFENLDLIINDGEFIFIVGNSGAGKSTILNIIGLMDNDYSGNYYIDSKLIKKENDDLYRKKHFGFIFQMYCLLECVSVYENLKIPLLYDDNVDFSRIDYVLNGLKIGDLKQKIVKRLSGGEKQRVAVARALMNDPQCIICDEPTGNLDIMNTKLIIDILRKENNKGRTIIIVTHDKSIIGKDDIVYEIQNKSLKRIQ